MKRISLLLVIVMAFIGGCQYDTVQPIRSIIISIPNYDFENWNSSYVWFLPGWKIYNTDAISSAEVSPDSNAYHGHYAMKLTNSFGAAYAETKFPVNVHPVSLSAFVKCKIVPLDTVSIDIKLFFKGKEVDSGAWKYSKSIASYKQIRVPISQHSIQVDSALIEISSRYYVSDFRLAKENDFCIDYLFFQVPVPK